MSGNTFAPSAGETANIRIADKKTTVYTSNQHNKQKAQKNGIQAPGGVIRNV
jgi:branched-subunit amino acid aminotransferase/4-amino-4-deoxychorismate lyase